MQPDCLIPGVPMNTCARTLYAERVLGHIDLPGEWAGWKLRGRWLLSPDGDKINPQALRGLLFRDASEKRLQRAQQANANAGQVIPLVLRSKP